MKKLIIIFIIIFVSMTNIFAYNLASIYEKIDIIYNKNPEKLNKLNNKIELYIQKTKKEKLKNILIKLNKYINFKFKNENYYNHSISENLKNKVKFINNNSFTYQIRLEKFNKSIEENNFSFIEKEFISFSILNAKVGILLNHQNFDEAKKIVLKYFKNNGKINNNKIKFLTKNVSYSDFSILPQLISWFNGDTKKVINYRIKYFPDEENTAYNIVRKIGYRNIKDCTKLVIKNENLDLIDKKFCKIINNKFEKSDLKDLDKLNNNLQNLSDRANYYSYVSRIKGFKNLMLEKKKKIGERILKEDKNFINGYIIMLNYYNEKDDCKNYKKYLELLEKNYIGDEIRKKSIFDYRKTEKCYLNIKK